MSSTSGGGVSLGFLLFIVFLILKLTHTVTWAWWIVTLPLWAGIALAIILIGLMAVTGLLVSVVAHLITQRKITMRNKKFRKEHPEWFKTIDR